MLRYRFLFEQMVRRELRQKYKGSALGVLWYLVNPLALMAAYGLMFGVLLKVPGTRTEDYLLFLFVGLIVWLFFSQSLLSASGSLLEQSSLVARVRFPRETVPASVVVVQLVTFLVLLVLVLPVALIVRDSLSPALLLLPVVVACLFALALGLALVAAIGHAYFRDVQPILAAAMVPWFFLTPIFYELELLPNQFLGVDVWRLVYTLNPMATLVTDYRYTLLYQYPVIRHTLISLAIAVTLVVVGWTFFRTKAPSFSEEV